MKISIIGSNGFLSTSIAQYAQKKGWIIDTYGINAPVNHKFDKFYPINLMVEDINYSNLMDSDIIVYAAGAGIQANLNEDVNSIYKLNATVPIRICNNLKQVGFHGRFVTFGSVFEIGETKEERFFSEKDILTSLSPAPNDYSVSKRLLSKFVSSYQHNFIHWHFIIPTIYGPGENPKRLIPYTISAIRHGENPHFTYGNQTRQYICVSEIPRLLTLAYVKKLPSGIYNIQGNETYTVKEIVAIIYHAMGKELHEECFGSIQRADIGMKYLALDGERLRDAISFEAETKIIDVICDY